MPNEYTLSNRPVIRRFLTLGLGSHITKLCVDVMSKPFFKTVRSAKPTSTGGTVDRETSVIDSRAKDHALDLVFVSQSIFYSSTEHLLSQL